MKITKMATIPVVASGWISGVIRIDSVCRAPGSGCLTSTGIGFSGWAFSRKAVTDSPLGLSISFLRSCRTSERPRAGRSTAQAVNLCIQCGLVTWQVRCKLIDLRNHQRPQPEDRRESHETYRDHRDATRQIASLEKTNEWRKDKAQQDGERDRY